MNEPGGAPWIDGAGTRRAGPPPAGWWQASDGSWYPPTPRRSRADERVGPYGPAPHTLEARPYIDGRALDRPRPGRAPEGGDEPTAPLVVRNGDGHRPKHFAPAGGSTLRPSAPVAAPMPPPPAPTPPPPTPPPPPPAPVPVPVATTFRAPYGDITGDRRQGGAYREPTPTEQVALLRSGEHRAIPGPPPPPPPSMPTTAPAPSGEHRVTRAPLAGLVDGFRSLPLWVRLATPMAGAVALLGVTGVISPEQPVDHEAISTQNTAPPPTEAPPTSRHPVMPAPATPPSSVPIVTAPTSPPATDPPPPPATDPEPAVTEGPTAAADDPGHVHYDSCDDARTAGAAPVRSGDAGYGTHLDRDRDGIACE